MIAYSYYEIDPRVIREAEAALSGGFEVDFLTLGGAGAPSVDMIRGVRIIRLNQSKFRGGHRFKYLVEYLKFFLWCFVKTTSLFFARRYAAIHVNNMPDFLVFCTFVPKLFGCKVILDIHDPMPETFSSKFKTKKSGFYYWVLLWQERLSAAYSDQVITVHELIKNGILVKHGIPAGSIAVVANFADEEVFKLRELFSVDGKIRLVFHGTILERSGLRTLIAGLDGMRHKDRVSLTIIGEGDFSPALKEMIESLDLKHVVEFDNRAYPLHAIPERIADCNVGVVPLQISAFTNYALPLKLIEYISLGLPVISVRSDVISFYLAEDDCIFFEWNDPSSLSRTLDYLAENPEVLTRYRDRSVALREVFSWAAEKKKYVALLRQLTGVHPQN